MNYYYLAIALPTLKIGEKPSQSFNDFQEELKINLSKKDLAKTEVIRRWIDLANIKNLLSKSKLDPSGNLTETELDEALLHQDILPEYVFEVIKNKDEVASFLKKYPSLLAAFFREESKQAKGFLKQFLQFEREARLIFLALRAKEGKRDFSEELQFEDPFDPFVADILAQKDSPHFEPPLEYEALKSLWERFKKEPFALAKGWIEYRFHKSAEMVEGQQFTIDFILAYLAQRILVEQWNALNEKEGQTLFQRLKE